MRAERSAIRRSACASRSFPTRPRRATAGAAVSYRRAGDVHPPVKSGRRDRQSKRFNAIRARPLRAGPRRRHHRKAVQWFDGKPGAGPASVRHLMVALAMEGLAAKIEREEPSHESPGSDENREKKGLWRVLAASRRRAAATSLALSVKRTLGDQGRLTIPWCEARAAVVVPQSATASYRPGRMRSI